jgi:hypothetical protein
VQVTPLRRFLEFCFSGVRSSVPVGPGFLAAEGSYTI